MQNNLQETEFDYCPVQFQTQIVPAHSDIGPSNNSQNIIYMRNIPTDDRHSGTQKTQVRQCVRIDKWQGTITDVIALYA